MKKLFAMMAIAVMAATVAEAKDATIRVINIPAEYEGWISYPYTDDIFTEMSTSLAKTGMEVITASLAKSQAYTHGYIQENTWAAYYTYLAGDLSSQLDTIQNGALTFTGKNSFDRAAINVSLRFIDSIAPGGHYKGFIYAQAAVVNDTVTIDMTGKTTDFEGTLHSDEEESALQDVENSSCAQKVLENGRLYILKGEEKYSVTGTKVE